MNQQFYPVSEIQNDFRFSFLSRKGSFFIALFLLVSLAIIPSAFSQQNSLVPFTFKLSSSAKTSAGVFKRDGTLIRTLWNNVSYPSGTHNGTWDRKNDEGRLVNDTGYIVKVVSNNVTYKWEGVIGNTSDSLTGSTVIRMFDRMHGIAIAGTNAYYGAGYTEGITSSYKFNTSNPQKKYNLLYNEVQQMYQASEFVATDSNYVYWAGYDPFDPKTSFVYATKVADDKEVAFSSGSSVNITYGRTYSKAIDLTTGNLNAVPKGLAVQKKGNYLFVSHPLLNELHVLNKSTGALIQTISITSPRDLAIDRNDNLWMIAGTNTVQKFTVNSNGTLSSATITLTGLVDPLALSVSPDNKTLVIIDGGSSQQLKAFDNGTGSSVWTYGQAGGYASDPAVTNDKFYFSDGVTMLSKPFIAFQPDGSFWVGDVGNERVQHYAANRSFIDRIMSLPHSYSVVADRNDPTRVFNEYLEFKIDYSKALAPNNGSWTLVRNWRRGITKDYFQEGKMNIFNQVITLSNGRTYATLENCKVPDVRYPEIVELPSSGHVRYTAVRFGDFSKDMIGLDGSLRRFVSSGKVGDGGYWETQALTGFTNNNPVWGTASKIGSIPTIGAKDPANGQISNPDMTSSDMLVVFERERYNTGFHLGAVKKNDNKYLWKACPATTRDYQGPFPTDGTFDIGNNVEYAGGHVYAMDKNILWNYHGEFWKNGQTNIWNHFYDNGLMIGQFGNSSVDAQKIDMEAFAMGAGNVFSSSLVKYGSDYYIYHNDESVHAGVHRWKISGLNTIQEQTITLVYAQTVSGGLIGSYYSDVDLNNINIKIALLNSTVNMSTPPSQITNSSSFSARWTGFVNPVYSQDYTFYTNTSKGVKLWIDGKLVINQWGNSSLTQYSTPVITLEAGKLYAVKMEINGGTASLSWSSSSQTKQIIPSGNLYPSNIKQNKDGIDLLEGLSGKGFLVNGMYGWSRNSVSEDSTGWQQYWHAKTGLKSYIEDQPDVFMTFRSETGQNMVTRDLGKTDTAYKMWSLTGTINYDADYAKWTTDQGGSYFDVLDEQGKIITRLTHEQYLSGSVMNTQIKFNNKVLVDKVDKYLYATTNKHQPFVISIDSAGMTFQYAGFTPISVKLFDSTSHWAQPTTVKFHFMGSSSSYDRMMDIGKLSFYASKKAAPLSSNLPDLQVTGNGVSILDGDITPLSTDNTNMGSILNNNTISKTFIIKNAGNANLSISTIGFTGSNASEFSIISAPSYPLAIAANGSYTLTVQFAPKTIGTRVATLNISSNDPNASTFNFDLLGLSISASPQIVLMGNSVNIADGDVSPTSSDNTDFGSINSGSTTTKTFVIQNTGTASLSVSSCSFTGTNASEFSIVNPPSYPLTIAVSAYYTLTVQFAPTSAGTRNATININSNDPNIATFNFDLKGTSLALSGTPQINVTGNSVNIIDGANSPSSSDNTDFGSITNSTSTTKTFVVKNIGTADLTISSCNFSGTNAAEFTIVSAPSYPLTITASSSYTFTVKFAPTSTGTRFATFNINNNDPNIATFNFDLKGTSVQSSGTPQINVTGNSVNIIDGANSPSSSDNTDFGSITNSTSVTKTFVVKNIGTANLSISSCNFSGTNAADYSIVSAPSYPLTIAPSSSYTFTVKFAPTVVGTRVATFNINNNDPYIATFNFDLKGTSVQSSGTPQINVTGNSVNIIDGANSPSSSDNTDFGSVNSGSSVTKTFVVKNIGTANLTISSCNFSGTNAADFAIVSAPSYPLTIAASSSYTFTVKFAPTVTGTRVATININNNDPYIATFNFDLKGVSNTSSGTPQINVKGNSVNIIDGDASPSTTDNTDFGSISYGSSTTKTFVVKNIGTASLSISGCSFTGTNASDFSIVSAPSYPLSIASGASYTFTVNYTPAAVGTSYATINFKNNDPYIATFDFALQGVAKRVWTKRSDSSSGQTSIDGNENTGLVFDYIVYPNPFTNEFHVRYQNQNGDDMAFIRIVNSEGKLVSELTYHLETGVNEIPLNGEDFAHGLYFITVRVGDQLLTKTIQK